MHFPAERRWLAFWIVLAAFVAVRATTRPDKRGPLPDHVEFGRRLLHGDDVYAPWRSGENAPLRPLDAPYPPSFGLLTAPFALVADTVSLPAARLCWSLLQIAAIAAIALVLRRLLQAGPDPPSPRAHRWLWLGALVLLSRFVLRDLHGGGGNVINIAFCALALLAAERGRPAASGWWLGFSLLTKPTQVWLLPVFFALGHRRAALHALVAGACTALLSLCLLRFDVGPWLRWFEGSLALARQTDAFAVPALGFPEFEWMNQSLRCAAARWLGTVPDQFAARVALGVAPAGLGLAPALAAWTTRLMLAAGLAAVLAVGARCRTAPVRARACVFAAALVLSLLASPLSWKAHHLALLPLVYLLLHHAATARLRATWTLLAALFVCCGLGQELLGNDVDEWLNSVYVLPLFDVLLFAAALRLALAQAATAEGTVAPVTAH